MQGRSQPGYMHNIVIDWTCGLITASVTSPTRSIRVLGHGIIIPSFSASNSRPCRQAEARGIDHANDPPFGTSVQLLRARRGFSETWDSRLTMFQYIGVYLKWFVTKICYKSTGVF